MLERRRGKMYNDTVSDFITRLRNATLVGKLEIDVKKNKLILELCELLKKQGFISSFKPSGQELKIVLNLNNPITHIKRLSKPGLRVYVSYHDIPRPKSGLGTVILTTPKGVLTGFQAHKQKVGGELICEVW